MNTTKCSRRSPAVPLFCLLNLSHSISGQAQKNRCRKYFLSWVVLEYSSITRRRKMAFVGNHHQLDPEPQEARSLNPRSSLAQKRQSWPWTIKFLGCKTKLWQTWPDRNVLIYLLLSWTTLHSSTRQYKYLVHPSLKGKQFLQKNPTCNYIMYEKSKVYSFSQATPSTLTNKASKKKSPHMQGSEDYCPERHNEMLWSSWTIKKH